VYADAVVHDTFDRYNNFQDAFLVLFILEMKKFAIELLSLSFKHISWMASRWLMRISLAINQDGAQIFFLRQYPLMYDTASIA
jgi:hypothetical protein